MKVIFIVGLPGSGKSHYAKVLAGKEKFILFDDPVDIKSKINIFDGYVIADPNLCFEINRIKAEKFFKKYCWEHNCNLDIEWIYFENDLETCRQNIERRKLKGDERKVDGFLKHLSSIYKVPDNYKQLKCYREEK